MAKSNHLAPSRVILYFTIIVLLYLQYLNEFKGAHYVWQIAVVGVFGLLASIVAFVAWGK